MRVHEITCQHLLSGIGRYGWELASGVEREGYLVNFYKPWKIGHSDEVYHQEKWVKGYKYRSLRDLHPYILPWFIRKSLEVKRGDILHAHWFLSGLAISKYKRNSKVITMHDVSLLHLPEKGGRYIDYYAKAIQKFKKLQIPIIVVSENAKSDTIKYANYPDELVHVVYNGINHDQFFPQENESKRPKNVFRVIYSGGLGKRKNVGLLLNAFKKFEESHPDSELVISGAHPERTSYPELASSLGIKNVKFTGFIPENEMADFYRSGHCMVFPSEYEGFGLAPLESMACGTPVLSAKGGALKETSGNGALYFDYNVDSLVANLDKVYSDTNFHLELTNRGLNRSKEFSWESTTKKTLDIYRTLI